MITVEYVKEGDFRMGETAFVNLDIQGGKLWMSRKPRIPIGDECRSWKVMCPAGAARINALLDRIRPLAQAVMDGCRLRMVKTKFSARTVGDFTDGALDALIAIGDMTEDDIPGLELCPSRFERRR